eukprot:352864-Amorphochlora_amoeboformis.AAC.2
MMIMFCLGLLVQGLCEWAVNSNIQDFTHEAKLIEADFTSSKTLSGILLALKWFSSVVGSKGYVPVELGG